MKLRYVSMFIMSGMIALSSCGGEEEPETGDMMMQDTMQPAPLTEAGRTATAMLSAASGSTLEGVATFTEDNTGNVTLRVNVRHVSPGKHAIHIHENGDCSAPDASSAGGHWNPTAEAHGKWGNDPYHKGDLGNLEVANDSTSTLTMTTDKWCVGCDDPMKNVVGKSVVIHAGVDDFTSQPSGDAGGRIGCGVIEMR